MIAGQHDGNRMTVGGRGEMDWLDQVSLPGSLFASLSARDKSWSLWLLGYTESGLAEHWDG